MSIFERLKQWLGLARSDQAPTAAPEGVVLPVVERDVEVEADEVSDATPVQPAQALPPNGKERRQAERLPAAGGVTVLVIDDSPTIVMMLGRMLEQNGYEVLEAGDAETGMEIARNSLPHLVFLDIVLPGMNGFEALRRLRRDPITRSIPVIMISGNELATEQFYAQRIGADDFMKKPFSRAEVFLRIESLLGPDRIPMPHVVPARA